MMIKISLFFYLKKINVVGLENIPKKGAVLFAVNHPNGLIDPLIVTTNCPRENYYLVRAAVFKKPLVKKFLGTLNLMPIYRIRDGASQLGKNKEIFEQCFDLFKKGKTLLIFPEGSHDRKRTIRPISKGFTRIVFGALEKYPTLKITIIPVGLTYQNASHYPAKVTVNYGKPITANDFYKKDEIILSTNRLKSEVSNQLKKLSVHLPNDENYHSTLSTLNDAQVDFTNTETVNNIIESGVFPEKKRASKNNLKPLYYVILCNSIIPYFIWKKLSKNIDEIEFVDTFRFGVSTLAFGFFYSFQTWIVSFLFDWKSALFYLLISIGLLLIYSKCALTNSST